MTVRHRDRDESERIAALINDEYGHLVESAFPQTDGAVLLRVSTSQACALFGIEPVSISGNANGR